MKIYLRSRIPEWLLCALIGLALTITFCSGFDMDMPGKAGTLLLFLFCLLLEFLLELASKSKETLLVGILLGCAAAAACFLYARTRHPLDDEAANARLITGMILAISQLLVHLLTRSRPGTVSLLLVGLLICAFTKFLQFPVPAWSYFLFFAAGVLMMLLRCYTVSLQHASMGSVHRNRLLLQAVAMTAAAAVLAGLVYLAVIVPLQPPTQELRLIQKLESMQLLQVLGVSSTRTVLDPNLNSNITPDVTELDREEEELTEEDQPPEVSQEPEEPQPPESSEEENQEDDFPDTESVTEEKIRYEFPVKKTIFFLIGAGILLIVALLVLRIQLRKRWQQQVDQLSNEDACVNYFRFFLRRIQRAGIPKLETITLQEYVRQNEFELSAYCTDSVTFGKLAAIYERCFLGGAKVTDEEVILFRQYYQEFFHNLRMELGFRRYWFRFFLF